METVTVARVLPSGCGAALCGTPGDAPEPGTLASSQTPARRHSGARTAARTLARIRPARVRAVGGKRGEEVTELVGLCLWDIFSDNHDVIAADGRVADIGSFRGAGAFLDEYLTRDLEGWRDGDYMRFYMGTIWISRPADLMPVYAMIFRRLKAAGADWVYHFPEIGIVELARAEDADKEGNSYSMSRAAVAELEAQKRRAEGRAVKGGIA